MFGHELKSTKVKKLVPDRTARLLPAAFPCPRTWAGPRRTRASPAPVCDAGPRRNRTGSTQGRLPARVREFVKKNVDALGRLPDAAEPQLGRGGDQSELDGHDRDPRARFALIVAKSAPQMDEGLVRTRSSRDEKQFIRTAGVGLLLGSAARGRQRRPPNGQPPASHGSANAGRKLAPRSLP